MIYRQRFLRTSVAPIAAVLVSLGATDANALSMGKLRVQSALGQSLVAEIDLTDVSEDDAGSLKSELAAPSTFTGMGLEYNAALNGTQIVLQRRQNGSRYLKVTGSRTLNDPFLDILVELSWGSGKIVRTYTILLDPPKSQDGTAMAALPAAGSDSQTASTKQAASTAATAASSAAAATNTPPPAAAASTKAGPNPAIAPAASSSGQQRVKVNAGDSAGKIARAWLAEGISMEQMLVAMLEANPSAFVDGNVNRLLANTEIVAPDVATVKKTSQADAQRLIQRQNQDFQNLRRTLAGQAPSVSEASKPTETTGKVAPSAPATSAKTPSGDTLKLSKTSAQDIAEKANMEQIAQQRAKNEASERARELAKNIEELNQLAKVAAKPEAAGASATPNAVASAPTNDGAAAPVASAASKPVAPSVTSAASAPVSAPAQGIVDRLMRNPEISALALALLALLGGLGWYRRRQSSKAGGDATDANLKWNASASTSFSAGSAQRVDTAEAHASGMHSAPYQESQLEMANELDPVAEAEVYLAYGKDVPAEEILKEGLQQTPNRVAIHLKLLAIYAKRGDADSFESMAREVHALTQGKGADWAQVLAMGLALDPINPLYGAGISKASEATATKETFQNSVFNLGPDDLQALTSSKAGAASASASGIPFEAGSMAPSASAVAPESAVATTERLEATLALAEQFLEIGEKEGARALIEEVIAGGNESLRKRATEMLAKAR